MDKNFLFKAFGYDEEMVLTIKRHVGVERAIASCLVCSSINLGSYYIKLTLKNSPPKIKA